MRDTALALDKFVAQNLPPDFVDFLPFAEEAMAADVEQISLVIHRTGNASYDVIAFQHNGRSAVLGEFVGGGQSRQGRRR